MSDLERGVIVALVEKNDELKKENEILQDKLKEAHKVIEFYAENVTSVWDPLGETLLEDCSVTARSYIAGEKITKKVYALKALEVGGYGEGDYTLGLYSTEKKALNAFDKFISNQDFPEEYASHIVEYNLDDIGDKV